MKRLFAIAAALALVFALTACGGGQETAPEQEENTQIPNPWVECATLEDASETAGFEIAVPDRIEGYPETTIQAVEGEMIQVFYSDKPLDDDSRKAVLIRKGIGGEDISGDYNEYETNETVEMHGVSVTCSGQDQLVYRAIWTQDGYSYSICADDGLETETIDALVELVK